MVSQEPNQYAHAYGHERDLRNQDKPVVQYVESHSDDVTEVCLLAHPKRIYSHIV